MLEEHAYSHDSWTHCTTVKPHLVSCCIGFWWLLCRQLWQLFHSLKQHFTSSQSGQSQCTAPPTTAAEAPSGAPKVLSNDASRVAELGRQLQRKLERNVPGFVTQDAMGPSTPGVIFELKPDGSVSRLSHNNDVDSGANGGDGSISHADGSSSHAESELNRAEPGLNQAESCACEDAPSDGDACEDQEAAELSGSQVVKPSSQPEVLSSRQDALSRRVCPAYGQFTPDILSLCHLPDQDPAHSCKSAVDCGVDSSSCRPRVCSMHGYCQAG